MVPTLPPPQEDIEAAIDRAIVEGYTRIPPTTNSTRCALNFDSLVVMRKSWFVEPICELSPVRMVLARRALAVAMGC